MSTDTPNPLATLLTEEDPILPIHHQPPTVDAAYPDEVTQKEANYIDLNIANQALRTIQQAWQHVKTFKQLDLMTKATFTAIEKRRAILNLEYGTKNKQQTVLPNGFID